MQDSTVVAQRRLCFYAYWLQWDGDQPKSQSAQLGALRDWGMPVNPATAHCADLNAVFDFYHRFEEQRAGHLGNGADLHQLLVPRQGAVVEPQG